MWKALEEDRENYIAKIQSAEFSISSKIRAYKAQDKKVKPNLILNLLIQISRQIIKFPESKKNPRGISSENILVLDNDGKEILWPDASTCEAFQAPELKDKE